MMQDINIDLSKLLIWLAISFSLIFIMVGIVVVIKTYLFGWSINLVTFAVVAVIMNAPLTVFLYLLCPEMLEVDY